MKYGLLFEVAIEHDYFLNVGARVHEALDGAQRESVRSRYASSEFLEVFPTPDTERVLAGHKLVFRATGSGFLVGTALDPAAGAAEPALPPGDDFSLCFALRVRDPQFFNYTELLPADDFYYFGNAPGQQQAGVLFLTAPVAAFAPARAYQAGELYAQVVDGSVHLFRALRDTGPAPAPVAADWERIPADTFDPAASYAEGAVVLFENRIHAALVDGPGDDLDDAADWQLLGMLANQYVTSADRRALRAPRFALDLSGAALSTATVRLSRAGEAGVAWERAFVADGGTLAAVELDLRALRPGAYTLQVLDGALAAVPALGLELYLDADAAREDWLGAVEIRRGSGNLALLTAGGALRSPRYTVRFLNRATRWRYLFPSAQQTGPGAEVAPEAGDDRVLVTELPLPLTRYGQGLRLQADSAGTPSVSEEVLLPRPEPRRIRRQNEQWFSEIHMSNLPL